MKMTILFILLLASTPRVSYSQIGTIYNVIKNKKEKKSKTDQSSSENQVPKLFQVKYVLEPKGLIYYRLPEGFQFKNAYTKERFLKLEHLLDTYKEFVKSDTGIPGFNYVNSQNCYKNAETYITMASMADKGINYAVYKDELNWYKIYNKEKLLKYEAVKDSITNELAIKKKEETRVKDSIELAKKIRESEAKSIPENFYADKSNPYGKLDRSLSGIGYNYNVRQFTTFRGLDINFCSGRFSTYLQTDFGLAYKNSSRTKSTRTERYVPKVSDGKEFLSVKYDFTNRADILGYIETEDKTYDIVNNVEIIGTKDLIINLFLDFWKPLQTKIGGYKVGEIASKQFYSDKIVLLGVSSSTAKISIQKGNMDMNYYETFGINAPTSSK